MALVLSGKDLEPLFADPPSMDGLVAVIEETLRAHQRGEIAAQRGFPLPMPDGKRNLRVITASLPAAGPVVRIHPQFPAANESHVILLFDAQSGELMAIVAGRELNVWRTGAPAGIASRYLARPGAEHLGLLGTGRQARGQLLAIRRAVPSLKRTRVFSPTEEHRVAFAEKMGRWLGVEVEAVANPRAALEGADIVGLATSSRACVLDSDWVRPGALVISITSGQVPEGLVACARVIVSWREEVLHGNPPRQPYASMIASGSWSGDRIAGELGEVILGRVAGYRDENEITLFELVGMPAWDSAASAWVYRWARERGVGKAFSLV
jgi:alanine dehydrogenase